MARKKITHDRSDVRAQWKLLKDLGEEPVAVKYHPDGTFRIMLARYAEITRPQQAGASSASYWDKVMSDGSP